MENNMPLLQINNLSKSYRSGSEKLTVLDNISLTIDHGSFLALLGPSGSGKSTLLHLIGTMDKADSGTILLNNQDLTRLSEKELATFRLKNIGFVFQFHYLLPEFTALENVAIPAMIAGIPRDEALQKAKTWLSYLALDHRLNHYPSELSGGEKQRVAIGRALINEPELILADEPTGNLDADTGQRVLTLFHRIHQEFGQTLILVTHDQTIAKGAETRLSLNKGKLFDCDLPQADEIHH
jgi:lipoprotein-releasing system ATP-binding protein